MDGKVTKTLMTTLLSLDKNHREDQLQHPDKAVMKAVKCVMLYAASDSPFLNSMVNSLLKESWFEMLGIDEEKLTETESLQVRFIFAGLVAVLGSSTVKDNPLVMPVLSQTDIGKAAVATMKSLSK